MAKQLAALLGGGLDLKALAEMLRRQGRGQDTILAHITPQEAALLKARGGAGTINPDTGLPEFQQNDSENYGYGYEGAPFTEPVAAPNIEYGQRLGEGPMEIGNPLVISDLNDTITPNQVSPQFEPSIQPSFRPSMNYGLGMYEGEMVGPPQVRDFKQEAIDRGEAPQRDMQDLVKSGAKQVLEGLKTPAGAALTQTALAALMARRGYKQARAMESELRQLGQAPRQVGQEQLGAGMRGELTPVQQQQIAAFQAQQRQTLANMGQRSGTAQQQLGARTLEMQQRGAQDLINQGLKNIGISDKYLQQAILAGYQADSQVADALGEALKAAGSILAGTPSTQVAKPVQTPATQARKTPLTSPLGG